MDLQRSLVYNFTYFHQDKSMDELRQSLLVTMVELEDTKFEAQQQLRAKDQQIAQLKDLLARAIRERDEAQHKLLLHSTPHSGISSIEEDQQNHTFSSSDCDESIVSSPPPVLVDRPLPENGKFLQAVMKAGPLLQTLLLAGPLPQWRHPPPPLDSYQIPPPPVVIPSFNQETFDTNNCRKRGLSEMSHSAINDLKYQRMVLQ